MPQILSLVLGKGWDERRGRSFVVHIQHPMETVTGIKRNLPSTCCSQGLQCFCPLKSPSPNLLSLQFDPKTKTETFTALPAKFPQAGRNDPREQSKMIEIEFKPLVCSCGRSGLASTGSRWFTPLCSPRVVWGVQEGIWAHPAVIYIVQSSSFLQGKKKQPSS